MIQNYYNPTKILTGSSLEILEKKYYQITEIKKF